MNFVFDVFPHYFSGLVYEALCIYIYGDGRICNFYRFFIVHSWGFFGGHLMCSRWHRSNKWWKNNNAKKLNTFMWKHAHGEND